MTRSVLKDVARVVDIPMAMPTASPRLIPWCAQSPPKLAEMIGPDSTGAGIQESMERSGWLQVVDMAAGSRAPTKPLCSCRRVVIARGNRSMKLVPLQRNNDGR